MILSKKLDTPSPKYVFCVVDALSDMKLLVVNNLIKQFAGFSKKEMNGNISNVLLQFSVDVSLRTGTVSWYALKIIATHLDTKFNLHLPMN